MTDVFSLMGKRALIMGILNVTPDSFSDGGMYADTESAVRRAFDMQRQGADIIDVGGESTRPGSDPVDAHEQIRRIVPVIKRISPFITVSADTRNPSVAAAALDAGASIINDVSGTESDEMKRLAAERRCKIVITHTRGTPKDMQKNTRYDDVVSEVYDFLRLRTEELAAAGVKRENIIIDPGFGFGKSVEDNIRLIARLGEFRDLGFPILTGVSRKSAIGEITGEPVPEKRLPGTAALVAVSVANGSDIVRVHDVEFMRKAALIGDAVNRINKEI